MEFFESIYHLLMLCTSIEAGGEFKIGEVDVDLLQAARLGCRGEKTLGIQHRYPSSATEALELLGH